MSGWLFNAKSVIVQLCHGENKLLFNEMMMFALYQTSPIHVHVHFVGFLLNPGGGRYNLWDFADYKDRESDIGHFCRSCNVLSSRWMHDVPSLLTIL